MQPYTELALALQHQVTPTLIKLNVYKAAGQDREMDKRASIIQPRTATAATC